MERDDIEYFLNKKVCIFHKSGFRFRGVIKNIGSTCLLLDDRYKGIMTIEYNDIEQINQWRKNEKH